jgi:hypothetical protein
MAGLLISLDIADRLADPFSEVLGPCRSARRPVSEVLGGSGQGEPLVVKVI